MDYPISEKKNNMKSKYTKEMDFPMLLAIRFLFNYCISFNSNLDFL